MECGDTTQKPTILFIRNTLKKEGNTKNLCYENLPTNKTQLSCLKDKYSAIVILDGEEYKQQTSHSPKFYITDPELDLPVVTISYQDQEKSTLLNSADGKSGAVVTDSIDKILDAKEMFNYKCDTNKCVRFEVLCLKKALSIIQKIL